MDGSLPLSGDRSDPEPVAVRRETMPEQVDSWEAVRQRHRARLDGSDLQAETHLERRQQKEATDSAQHHVLRKNSYGDEVMEAR